MMNKAIGISFLLISYVILLVHNIIPHHSHDEHSDSKLANHVHHHKVHTHHHHHLEDLKKNSDAPCNEETCEELIIHDLIQNKSFSGVSNNTKHFFTPCFYYDWKVNVNKPIYSYLNLPIPPFLHRTCFNNHLIPSGLRAPPCLIVC